MQSFRLFIAWLNRRMCRWLTQRERGELVAACLRKDCDVYSCPWCSTGAGG